MMITGVRIYVSPAEFPVRILQLWGGHTHGVSLAGVDPVASLNRFFAVEQKCSIVAAVQQKALGGHALQPTLDAGQVVDADGGQSGDFMQLHSIAPP